MESPAGNDFVHAAEKLFIYRESIVSASQELLKHIIEAIQSVSKHFSVKGDKKIQLKYAFDQAIRTFTEQLQNAHDEFAKSSSDPEMTSENLQTAQLNLSCVSMEDLFSGSENFIAESNISNEDNLFVSSDDLLEQDLRGCQGGDGELNDNITEVEDHDGGECGFQDIDMAISDSVVNDESSKTVKATDSGDAAERLDVFVHTPVGRLRNKAYKHRIGDLSRKTCHKCGETFSNTGNLNKHKARKHNNTVPCVEDAKSKGRSDKRPVRNAMTSSHVVHNFSEKTSTRPLNMGQNLQINPDDSSDNSSDSLAASEREDITNEEVDDSVPCTPCEDIFVNDALFTKDLNQKPDDASWNLTRSSEERAGSPCPEKRALIGVYCEICDKLYSSRSNLNKHLRVKHGNDFVTKNRGESLVGNLQRKLRANRSAGGADSSMDEQQTISRPQCDICAETFCSTGSLKRHINRKHPIKYGECENQEQKYQVCDICEKSFTNSGDLRKHIIQAHGCVNQDGNHVKCGVCKETLSSTSNLLRHMRRKHMVPSSVLGYRVNFECKICNATFETSALLAEHATSCFLICSLCSKTFNQKQYFTRHLKTHEESRSYLCSICPKRFKRSDVLKCHERSVHGINCKFHCEPCNKSFSSSFKLQVHKARRHTGQRDFTCEFCARSFFTMEELKVHIVARHGVKTKFQCDICSRFFALKSLLIQHMRVKHERTATHRCSSCHKMFVTLGAVKQHMKSHTREKNYSCTFCGASFVWSGSLSQHLATVHNQGGVFKCDICDREYRTKNQLSSHKKSKHGPKQTHVCQICNTTCSTRGTLNRHKRRKHSEQPGAQDNCLRVSTHAVDNPVDNCMDTTYNPVQDTPSQYQPYIGVGQKYRPLFQIPLAQTLSESPSTTGIKTENKIESG